MVGFTQGMISQFEKGTSTLNLDHIKRLAKALKITPKQLQFRHPDADESIEDIYDELESGRQRDLIDLGRNWRKSQA